MSERLRDLVDADDPAVAELARMVRAASDLDPLPGAQDRVRAGLAESRQRRRRSWRPALVGVMVAGATLVLIIGVQRLVGPDAAPHIAPVHAADGDGSNAAIARAAPPTPAIPPRTPSDLRTGGADTAELRPQPGHESAASPELPSPSPRDDAATVAAVPEQPPSPPEPAPIRRPGRVGGFSIPRIAPARQASKAVAPEVSVTEIAPPATPQPERKPESRPEAALILDALQKLRHDRDAAGALRLLDAYRAGFPDGDLAEEALVLSIEARAALGDGEARAAAAEYLRRFPHGRFRGVAEDVQRRFRDR